jgi:hypothetical protein
MRASDSLRMFREYYRSRLEREVQCTGSVRRTGHVRDMVDVPLLPLASTLLTPWAGIKPLSKGPEKART